MSKSLCILVARLFALSVILSLLSFSPPTASAQACDRACLTGMMTRFINALVAHDLVDAAPGGALSATRRIRVTPGSAKASGRA